MQAEGLASAGDDGSSRAPNKSRKGAAVAECVARLLSKHGFAGITHARVARASGVSRAWLYKYVGTSRDDLIRFATVHFGDVLAEFHERPRTTSAEVWIEDTLDGVRALLKHADEHPWVLPLYYQYQGSETALGEAIAEVERAYLETTLVEVRRALGLSASSARWVAEVLLTLRMAFAHRHQRTGLLRQEFDRFAALLRSLLRSLPVQAPDVSGE